MNFSKQKFSATTSALALTLSMFGYGRGAYAGSCSGGPNVFTCSGPADPATDETQAITVSSGSMLVQAEPGFGLSVNDRYGFYLYTQPGTVDLILEAGDASYIKGDSIGIRALSRGTGALSIEATRVISDGAYGIFADSFGTSLDIKATDVIAQENGVLASNRGSGALTIDVDDVTGYTQIGLRAVNEGTSLTITAGSVVGGSTGIYGYNSGTSNLSITADSGKGGTHGVYAISSGTDLEIKVKDAEGTSRGVNVRNSGSGFTDISVERALGGYFAGVSVASAGTNLKISVVESAIGNDFGILSQHSGTGSHTVTTKNAYGKYKYGIFASNAVTASDLSISVTGNSGGGLFGIYALNQGTGELKIKAEGAYGASDAGIKAINLGTNLIISSDNMESYSVGGVNGVTAFNYGSGELVIKGGYFYGMEDVGIYAENFGTDLSITSIDAVRGQNAGIMARNHGTGNFSISAAKVDGLAGDGIRVRNYGSDLGITSGEVTGNANGISAENYGDGALVFLSYSTTGIEGNGITAYNGPRKSRDTAPLAIAEPSSGPTSMTILHIGEIYGGVTGLSAVNYGTGQLIVFAADEVTGVAGDGIYARNSGESMAILSGKIEGEIPEDLSSFNLPDTGDVDADFEALAALLGAGSVSGGRNGIDAANLGSGPMVLLSGDVQGAAGDGIRAVNQGTDMIGFSLGQVTGSVNGIYATNQGSGAMVFSTVNTLGEGLDGIDAYNAGTDQGISVTGAAIGQRHGVRAENAGSGAQVLTIESAGGRTGSGIFATNYGTNLYIGTGYAVGETFGILADNYGSGEMTIEAYNVAGNTFDGISAFNAGTNQSIVSYGSVAGERNGVRATNAGTGGLLIDVVDVTGKTGDGINAFASGTDLIIISRGTVTGGNFGVSARNDGTGLLSITALDVVGSGPNGISAVNKGSGALTIEARNVDAQGKYGSGIFAQNYGTDISIAVTESVRANHIGVFGVNSGNGALSITVGETTALGTTGILADGEGDGTDVTVRANGKVTANSSADEAIAIEARNFGSGSVLIETTDVEASEIGILAKNSFSEDLSNGTYTTSGNGKDITIVSTGKVQSGDTGILLVNGGTGASIVTTNNVEATDSTGIYAFNAASASDMVITSTGKIEAKHNGVWARNNGTGQTTISVKDVESNIGVFVARESLKFGPGNTPATQPTGPLSITVNGAIATAFVGVYLHRDDLSSAQIMITETGSIQSGNYAIFDGANDTSVTLQGAILAGTVDLSGGNDAFTVMGTGASIASGIILDGGADFDALTFDDTSQNLAGFRNFEATKITNGSVARLDNASFSTLTFGIDGSSALRVNGASQVTGNATGLMGTITMRDGATDDVLTFNGLFGGGALELDAKLDGTNASDRLVLNGTAGSGGATLVKLNNIGTGTINLTSSGADGVLLVDVTGTSTAGDFVLAGGAIGSGAGFYDISRSDTGDFFLKATGTTAAGTLYPQLGNFFSDFWGTGTRSFGPPADGPGNAPASRNQLTFSSKGVGKGGILDNAWFRAFGARTTSSAVQTIGTANANSEAKLSFGGFQVGTDVAIEHSGSGEWTASGSFAYVQASLDATNTTTNAFAGSAETKGFAGTLGLNYANASGYFAGTEIGYLAGDVDVSTAAGATGSTDGHSLSFSVGAGRSIDMGNGFTLSPSVHMAAITSGVDSFTDSAGNRVTIPDRTVYRGRLGFDASRTMAVDGGSLALRGGLFLEREVGDSRSIATISGVPVTNAVGALNSGEVSFGLEWSNDAGSTSAWADVRYKDALDGQRDNSLSATLGLQIRF